MDVQQIASLALVAAAMLYLARHGWRKWRSRDGGACSGCSGACGKPAPPPLITLERRPPRSPSA